MGGDETNDGFEDIEAMEEDLRAKRAMIKYLLLKI